jgi:response regulator of citrate/malate metabolism
MLIHHARFVLILSAGQQLRAAPKGLLAGIVAHVVANTTTLHAYLPATEVAAHLSVSEATVRRIIKGRIVRISLTDLDEFIATHRLPRREA